MTTVQNTEAQVAIVALTAITEGSRRREDYGDMEELVSSIKEKGLIMPLAVCLTDDGKYQLLAGGRRFQALKHIGVPTVPVRIYPEQLSDLERRAIELEENIKRKNLSWQEEVTLCQEIHNLEIAIHGKKISTSPDAPGHSLRDTAKLVNESPAGISKKLKVARAMEEFPDMGWEKCKTQQDAEKLLKKVTRHIVRDDLAAEAEASYGDESVKSRLAKCYIVKDFLKGLDDLPDGAFNLVEIDPPYAIDLTKQKKEYNYEGYNEIAMDDYEGFMLKVLQGCYQKMSPNSWLILWFGPDPWFEVMHKLLIEAGFQTTRMVGIWNKKAGQSLMPTRRLANSYEMFYYASKGTPDLAKPGRSNVFEFTTSSQGKFHPTQRPVAMYEELLGTFAQPNARVLIPFAGSGSAMVAAAKLNMHPIGYDLTHQYKQEFIIRLGEEL